MKRFLSLGVLALVLSITAQAQITGGQHAFEFLRMSNSPYISASGGYAPASMGNDVSLTLQNPGLLNPKFHNQLSLSYNAYYAGISIANLQYAYHVEPLKTTFSFGIQYLNYGSFEKTDLYGNILGEIKASDFSLNLSASRKYLERWTYGATLKIASSNLGSTSATAVLGDVGLTYEDTTNLLLIGVVAKNMGFTLKKYNNQNKSEPLPFDLQLGISKQLKNVPLRLFMVAHHLYEWDVRYDNPADFTSNNLFGDVDTSENKSHFVDKLFRHLNFGAELILGNRVYLSGAYNHIRRSELGYNESKGLAGFSFGIGVNLNKFMVRYSRSYFATAGAYNEFGLSMQLNKLFKIGKKTEPWGWDKSYL